MKTVFTALLIIWLILNLITFALYGIDKKRAKRNQWRIPEAVLIIFAVFGIIGAILGMRVFHHKTKKLKFRILIPLIFVCEAVIATAAIVYLTSYAKATDEAKNYLSSDTVSGVEVTEISDGWLFDGPGETEAMVFYPGAKVDTAAYAPLASAIAARGMDCFLVDVPMHMAIFGIDTAEAIITDDAYSYETWYLGGHSMGGAAACMYAASVKDSLSMLNISGLFLCGAYVPSDLTDTDLTVAVVYGDCDGVLEMSKLEAGRAYVSSANYFEKVISGGNHAQFGMYGEQKGDGTASIDTMTQINEAADFVTEILE